MSEARPAQMRRLRMSRPCSSVPSRWPGVPMGARRSTPAELSGSHGLMSGAASAALSVKHLEFVEAARGLGASRWRLIGRHLLPNVLPPLLVYTSTLVGMMIVASAGLSFLGLGVQPPTPDWGVMRPGRRRERAEVNERSIKLVHGGHRGSHQADHALPDGLEHRLNVGRRAADDAQNFCGCRLLLQHLSLSLQGLGLALERLRQALLEILHPGAFALPRR